MPRKRPPPYIEKLGQRGRIAIWLVDGAFIRTGIDIEFDNFGQHSGFDFIPANEFWLDHEKHPDELKFFVERMAAERRLVGRGMDPTQASEKAAQIEQALRDKAGDLKKLMPDGNLPDPERAHVELWKALESGVSVWMVNGRLVRSVFDLDYTLGGHDHVYEFIPGNEIWIDNDMSDLERGYVLIHEMFERNRMLKGWDYTRAHTAANKIEARCRKHPNQLHTALAAEGWEAG